MMKCRKMKTILMKPSMMRFFSLLVLIDLSWYVHAATGTLGTQLRAGPGSIDAQSGINKRQLDDRFKREIHPNSEKLTLGSTTVNLNDSGHNQAVVHWSGKNSNVVFVLTRRLSFFVDEVIESSLFRSDDYGSSFKNIDSLLKSLGVPVTVDYLFNSVGNKDKIILTDKKHKQLFISANEGVSFTRSAVSFTPSILTFHPLLEDWCYAIDQERDNSLYVSKDLGRSWLLVRTSVNQVMWMVPDIDTDNSTLHIEYHDVTGAARYQICAEPYCTETTPGNLTTIDMGSLVVSNEFIVVEKTGDNGQTRLFVSYNRGDFREALFPPDVVAHDFVVVDSDENQLFVAVNPYESSEASVHIHGSNLYMSDTTGHFFMPNLEGVLTMKSAEEGFLVDLYEVKGIRGCYIANVLDHRGMAQTKITFDKGRNWTYIEMPDASCHANGQKCLLQLHLRMSYQDYATPMIYSEDNAPGLILAHGTSGPWWDPLLPESPKDTKLYLSRDGGLRWKEVNTGLYHAIFLDQGGVIALFPNDYQSPQDTLFYSLTEGATWEQARFTNSPFIVEGVLIEPGITSLVLSVFGHHQLLDGWIITKVDFSSVLARKCSDDDHEEWTPSDEMRNRACILGEKLVFDRRKQNASCANGRDYERPIRRTSCNCSSEDYECDFGYSPMESLFEKGSLLCRQLPWLANYPLFDDCPEGSTYNKSRGFRKLAADKCIPDKDSPYGPEPCACPTLVPQGLSLTIDSEVATPPVVVYGRHVYYLLHQERGSKLSTDYTFYFGDGTNETHHGLAHLDFVSHLYHQLGSVTITVRAVNVNGTAEASLTVQVVPDLRTISLYYQKLAYRGEEVSFTATPDNVPGIDYPELLKYGDLHFIWDFGDGQPGSRQLTWEPHLNHTYQTSGTYNVIVQAVNGAHVVYGQFTVQITDKLQKIRLTFSQTADMFDDWESEAWRRGFSETLKKFLMLVFQLSPTEFDLFILDHKPTTADMVLLNSSQNIDDLIRSMIQSISQQKLHFEYRGMPVEITTATAIDYDKSTKNLTAVYIAVPILVAAVIVILLVVIYYRRKFRGFHRYSSLRNATDGLIRSEESDDELLDPGLTQHAADDLNTFGQGSTEPHLVMLNRDDRTALVC